MDSNAPNEKNVVPNTFDVEAQNNCSKTDLVDPAVFTSGEYTYERKTLISDEDLEKLMEYFPEPYQIALRSKIEKGKNLERIESTYDTTTVSDDK